MLKAVIWLIILICCVNSGIGQLLGIHSMQKYFQNATAFLWYYLRGFTPT